MAYLLTGKCNNCGECCRAAFLSRRMSVNNNVIDGVKYCDAAYKDGDIIKCRFMSEVLKYDVAVEISKEFDLKQVSDDVIIASGLSKDQADYCSKCMAFPDPNIRKHWAWVLDNKAKNNIPNCAFSYEVIK